MLGLPATLETISNIMVWIISTIGWIQMIKQSVLVKRIFFEQKYMYIPYCKPIPRNISLHKKIVRSELLTYYVKKRHTSTIRCVSETVILGGSH